MQEINLPRSNSPQTTEVQPVLIANEQSKSNNFLTILLSVLLFLAVMIAGFFAYQTQKLVAEVTNYKEQLSQTIEPISTPDPTADWKTYKNDTYGFAIKYPSTWKEITTEEEKLRGNVGYTNLFTVLETDKKEFVSITVFDGSANLSNNNQSYKTFDLKNNKSVSISYTDNLGPGTKPGVADISIFDQILSTFKFTN